MTETPNYYVILGLTPWADQRQIRQSYRDLSKLYHPDTTRLPQELAIAKFREINQAYATLSNPERRSFYDRSIQFSRVYQFQTSAQTPNSPNAKSFADQPLSYDSGLPSERPLSAGELFALFVLIVTLVVCVGLAIAVSVWRGDRLFPM